MTRSPAARRAFLIDVAWLLVSMALWAAAFHPLDLWPLAWIAMVPAFVRLGFEEGAAATGGTAPPRRRLALAWVIAQYWLHVALMGWAGVIAVPLAFLTPLLGMPFSWLTGFLLERGVVRLRIPLLLGAPLIIVMCEVLRDQALLSLTWASIGYSQWRWTDLVQIVSVGRVHLVSLVILIVNAAIATSILRFRARAQVAARLAPLALGALVLAAGVGAGSLVRQRDFAPGPMAVGLQPNVPQAERARIRSTGNLRIHADLLADFRATQPDLRPDLLVYSETSFPSTEEPRATLERFLATRALAPDEGGPGPAVPLRDFVLGESDQVTILGLVRGKQLPPAERGGDRDDDDDGYDETNVAWVVRGGIPTADCYEKRGLAPFGEFTPIPKGTPGRDAIQAMIKKAVGRIPGLNPGTSAVSFEAASPSGPRRGGLTICFEIAFSKYFRESAMQGADFHVNISNDAWFDGSSELALVDVATRFRALETGRAIIRVSNSGISTLFAPDGERVAVVEDRTGRRTQVRGWFAGRIPIGRGVTPYVRLGDLPWIGGAIVLLVAFWIATIRAKRLLPSALPR